MLSGLTEEYKPFIMGLEANGVGISGDLIASKLLDSCGGNNEGVHLLEKSRIKNGKANHENVIIVHRPNILRTNAISRKWKGKPKKVLKRLL